MKRRALAKEQFDAAAFAAAGAVGLSLGVIAGWFYGQRHLEICCATNDGFRALRGMGRCTRLFLPLAGRPRKKLLQQKRIAQRQCRQVEVSSGAVGVHATQ
eukprot:1391205-Amphidinium_carterae.2